MRMYIQTTFTRGWGGDVLSASEQEIPKQKLKQNKKVRAPQWYSSQCIGLQGGRSAV